ncbi:hypothetical protein AMATHDRAFT_154310 [Amanita thiersii Skay4041]|uniref:Uncharacterized protein n=1 Tax=Amanita thiersii Skay4041 TaxID=703135 RepID=A0A2A9N7T9_9AGAR|nr:hypothetical protein AMATHDRAFT_154310 [Amanita thiersii Skay4041]
MAFCNPSGPLDFQDPCIRASWSALVPFSLVFLLCFVSIPIPLPGVSGGIAAYVKAPFRRFLTLYEAEALDPNANGIATVEHSTEMKVAVPLNRTSILIFVGLAETLCWLSFGSYNLITSTEWVWAGGFPFLTSLSWLYTALRPIVRPVVTVPLDLFCLYSLLFSAATLQFGGVVYDYTILGSPLPPALTIIALSVNLVTVALLLGVVLAMPFAVPSHIVKIEDIGRSVTPEEYTSLLSWLTYSWVYPLIRRGRSSTLNEDDVWSISITMQSRPILQRFKEFRQASLVRRFWAANSFDFFADLSLTIVKIMFMYTGPFFLKQILDALDAPHPTAESRAKAYIYAVLAFICTMCMTQAEGQHEWFSHRVQTRMRSELMASIYEKSLKRKDFSGIIDKSKQNEQQNADKMQAKEGKSLFYDKKAGKENGDSADNPRAGADIGKIVNLMGADATMISDTVSNLFMIYGAPFEFLIAGTFLYHLLGWSAFVGFFALLAGWPLNSWMARRRLRIQKGTMAARDKRMAIITELLGSIKFIKFFAWEDKWIQRALDAREVELKWRAEARLNAFFFYSVWGVAPVLVSIISLFVYVMQGNKLTVSVAFTSIALFDMIRFPLNIFPTWIMQVLQANVALKRIAVYLGEDEVTEQVSSLKNDSDQISALAEEGLGLENASFKWNEVESVDDANREGGLATPKSPASSSNDNVTIEVDDSSSTVDLAADVHKRRFELRDVNIRFPDGQLTLVTGPTASGKTALLMAVLGEMTTMSGRIIMSKDTTKVDENGLIHSISYAAQMPWIRHQSIKDNILFDSPFDEERYNTVIECCALKPDLDMFEDADATEIGARGVNLSGGQKARVALARAVYARTKYVLLDDPLSAVDSPTARFLFENLFCGPLLANRTVVLVTHHIDLVLPGASYLVRMLDGTIDSQGTIEDLRVQGILERITKDESVQAKEQENTIDAAEAEVANDYPEKKIDGVVKVPRKLVDEEHREAGGVKWSIYKKYLKASSYWIWVLLVSIIVLKQVLGVAEKVWVKIWGEAYGAVHKGVFLELHTLVPSEQGIPHYGYAYHAHQQPLFQRVKGTFSIDWPAASQHPLFYVGIFAAIGIINSFTHVFAVTTQYTGALRASHILFKYLLITVMRATFRFHDTTPQGWRMLNRFGKDIETIDISLPQSITAVTASLAGFFAAVLTVAFVFPLFLIPGFFIGFWYYDLATGYLNTGRDLRRMESNTRSPIFSDFSELLEGIVTVRAFSAERRFLDALHRKIDITTKMWYTAWLTNRWLLFNFDLLGTLAVLITTLFSIFTLTGNAGLAGLCITSAMSFTGSVYWACRFWTGLELNLNSIERIVEYLDIPQEPPAVIESNHVPAYWPSTSNRNDLLSVENLSVKYGPDLPSVVQDISFTLKAGERVGLLGRTGSGKSTLAMSILRFVDPASGRIIIDGIDISTIGLQDLRSRITFIPQDATLFSGTLRDNLDPFGEYEDGECWDVLYRVQMIEQGPLTSTHSSTAASRETSRPASALGIEPDRSTDSTSMTTTAIEGDSKTKITLDTQVSAGGTNFSQGQRQLIAMARALLRRSSIIVLDEATSSIDFATDGKIQATIREQFTDSLLLTVAHRLRTIIDYDRLIVLDKGRIVEFDTPWNLIQKEDGVFRSMCLKSGSFGELEATARAKAEISALV